MRRLAPPRFRTLLHIWIWPLYLRGDIRPPHMSRSPMAFVARIPLTRRWSIVSLKCMCPMRTPFCRKTASSPALRDSPHEAGMRNWAHLLDTRPEINPAVRHVFIDSSIGGCDFGFYNRNEARINHFSEMVADPCCAKIKFFSVTIRRLTFQNMSPGTTFCMGYDCIYR